MNRYNSKFTIVSICFISAILAFTIIIEADHITPALAQTTGSYSEVSRIINIPKDMPNSSSSLPNIILAYPMVILAYPMVILVYPMGLVMTF